MKTMEKWHFPGITRWSPALMVLAASLISSTLFYSCKSTADPGLTPVNLTCEYLVNPVGIDYSQPRLSWILPDTSRGAAQSAYRVIVASSPGLLEQNSPDTWDSKKVMEARSRLIDYRGPSVESGKRYYWKVMIWNEKGIPSGWSDLAWFEMGKLSMTDWSASWIANQDTGAPLHAVNVRKEFTIDTKPLKKARLYATGLGAFVPFLNGQRVGDDFFSPGWTDYHHRVQHETYDIAGMLKPGSNAMGLILGNMWWSSGLGWNQGSFYSNGPLRCMAQIEIEYEDGEKLLVVTDGSWKLSRSAITSNTLYHGEEYDARLEQVGWTLPGFNDAQWQNASVIDTFSRQINGRNDPPVRVTAKIEPVTISKVGSNSWVFDFGQNMVGLAKLKVQGKPGQKIVMRFAELLHPDGRVAQENLRSAKATDVYICKGEGIEEWHPWFTYHGFRYVQVEGLTAAPDKETLTGLVLNSDLPFTGEFSASADILNRVQKNIQWGQRGNLVSVPTDCPQRDERLGWMGDVQVFAPTSIFNMDMMAFYRKWMRDIRDGQHPDGWVHDVNPEIVVGGPSKPAWGDAVVIVPWMLYKYYGDKQVLEENYKSMKAWVDYMQALSKNDIYEWGNEDWGGYGDWVAVDPSPTKPTGTLYYYYSSYLFSKIAGALGNSKDQQYYEELSGRVAKAYHAKYFDPSTGQYEGATQFANLMPLAFGITPAEDKDRVLQNLVADINRRGNHLSTGFLGTAYLLPVLTDNGFVDLAYELATKTSYPSWGYMVEQGATTIWELWNSDKEKPEGMNSRNHFAYGSVGEWYFRYLAGINPVAEMPGFQKVRIQPVFPAGLDHAQASYLSGYGTISSAWRRVGNGLQLEITIPANASAQLLLNPGVDSFALTERGVVVFEDGRFTKNPHTRLVNQEKGLLEMELTSGSYQFGVVNQ